MEDFLTFENQHDLADEIDLTENDVDEITDLGLSIDRVTQTF